VRCVSRVRNTSRHTAMRGANDRAHHFVSGPRGQRRARGADRNAGIVWPDVENAEGMAYVMLTLLWYRGFKIVPLEGDE
jgi:hypothetical protein